MIGSLLRHCSTVSLLIFLTACAVAPGTGRTIFTGGLSEEDEKRIGQSQHEPLLQAFAGVGQDAWSGRYDDAELQRYVASVGARLARSSEMAHLKFTFTVVDSPIANAFALPGGYIYVTRGLLALARDEAELAGVLAHEIGHVTARHSTERHGDAIIAGGGTLIAGLLLGDFGAQAGRSVGEVALSSYSRAQESEADTLGLR